ncbi:molybdenum cofactor biosysynthesis protein [Aeromicrobium flavum]|uniref:Molybdenum cofactor biosysynthesis protein n=1 Tax=Aeromicrobium flavum TaxID=416568 RepID=A0A512HY48_9ACTN|nr:MOSC N-terminal beta barrel domain-containing protein [Aeromicrobium flavum]GEO90365.1 molybdenum cofactor biosysynthesis protein [Aeromicrobium flavum]
MHLTSVHRYPLKSARVEDLTSAVVEPWGLAGDRRWMVVDEAGGFLTARETRRLLTVLPRLTDIGLSLSAPGAEPLEVVRPDPRHQVPVELWKSEFTAAEAPEAARWLSDLLGRPVRLVHLDDPTRRPVTGFARPEDRVNLADGYPLLVTTQASLAALNDEIVAGGGAPVPMARFRPSIVVDGDAPWTEDDWRLLRVGEAVFRAVKGCARCVITTLEPDLDTGEVAGGKEPLRTLARVRRFGTKAWFGVNLIPDTPGAIIRAGDEVEVLETAPSGAGPLGA